MSQQRVFIGDTDVAKRHSQLQSLFDKIGDLNAEIDKLIESFLPDGLLAWEARVSMARPCSSSPFGACVYKRFEAPYDDGCVFCGQPLERK